MEAFLADLGITQTDILNIVAIIVTLLVILGILRAAFKLTRTIMRMGCAVIVLIAGIAIFIQLMGS